MTDHAARRTFRPIRFCMLGLTVLLASCARVAGPPAPPTTGTVVMSLPASREVQYSASQIKALDLTLIRANSSVRYFHHYTPASVGSTFTFSALNLPVGTYGASLAAYYATATSSANLVGSTATDSFTVTAGATKAVKMPPLTLSATPTGNWSITVSVSVNSYKYTMSQATSSLSTAYGLTVTGPNWTTTSKTLKWFNILTYPAGVSTASVTVKATRSGYSPITSTKTVTRSVVPGDNPTSSLSFTL